jgi:SAM-dependent methyltransferase
MSVTPGPLAVGPGHRAGAVLPGLRAEIARYYSDKVRAHGPTPSGADWSCVPTQELRFVQLLKLCDFHRPFSLNDIGCGYGALLSFLGKRHRRTQVDYLGIDLSAAMIDQATAGWRRSRRGKFTVGHTAPRIADYCVASGIFNVKLDQPTDAWEAFVAQTLDDMHEYSRLGFAANFLSPRVADECIPELYCAPPERWARHCEEKFGSRVAVLSSYGMREFTLLVRREPT